jgi:hypothetical protein
MYERLLSDFTDIKDVCESIDKASLDELSKAEEKHAVGAGNTKLILYLEKHFGKMEALTHHLAFLVKENYYNANFSLWDYLKEPADDIVVDYIASMTDDYFIDYFKRFDRIVMYYDNGQENLSVILESIFDVFDNFEHIVEFDHVEKRLFQVSDMLTFIDKYDYKYKNKISISKSEKFFFSNEEIRRVLKELNKKRF